MSTVAIDDRFAAAIAALRGLPTDHNPDDVRTRVELAERQGWACTWCKKPLTPEDIGAGRTHKDHVIPIRRGGPDQKWNRALLHDSCNHAKGTRMTADAWALATEHAVTVKPLDPGQLYRAVGTLLDCAGRLARVVEDFEVVGAHVPVGAWGPASTYMTMLLDELNRTARRMAQRAASEPTAGVMLVPDSTEEPPF